MSTEEKAFYENLKIAAADYIIKSMVYSEEFNLDRSVVELDINKIVPGLSKENAKKFNQEFQHQIYNHLLHSGYIERTYPIWGNSNYDKWCKLTDHGKEVKRYGGHIAYLDYKQKMDKVPFEAVKWAKAATYISMVSIVVTITLWIIEKLLRK